MNTRVQYGNSQLFDENYYKESAAFP
jgi:hypothetical protein